LAPSTRIFEARRILTMDPNRPNATHVAVRAGRILGVGDLESLRGWGDAVVDRSLRDQVLMPGLVEAHSHALEGWVWNHAYLGSYSRRAPDGTVWPGATSIAAVLERLRGFAEDRGGAAIVTGWGFDPLFVERALTAADLDRVSTERPVVVYHASFHIVVVNSLVLRRAGLADATNSEFLLRGEDGRITGELAGQVGRYLMAKALESGDTGLPTASAQDVRRLAASAQAAGVTTVTDLHNDLEDKTVETYRRVTAEADFPARIVPALRGTVAREDPIAFLGALVAGNTEKLRFGPVKFVVDGSIQGFTARLKWPGYFNGRPDGLWYIAPDELKARLKLFHEAGFQVHIHTNGDMATELALDVIEAVLIEAPRPDHRHTLQHCQMADAAQFRRMAALGVCVNLFANHVYYWGDAHYALTMGPDRAERMDACGTAMRCGVPFAIHSDAPITPIGPLFTAWCAVNRLTAAGRVLGEGERIPVEAALRAITLGAAYTLKMDDVVGSVEVGKFADFCVLEDDPSRSRRRR
jgi:predicted amidohydrolase YtcJ